MSSTGIDDLKQKYSGLLEESLIELIWNDYKDRPEEADKLLKGLASNTPLDPTECHDIHEAILKDTEQAPSDHNIIPTIDISSVNCRADLLELLCQCLPECPKEFIEHKLNNRLPNNNSNNDNEIDPESLPSLVDAILDDYYTDSEKYREEFGSVKEWMNNSTSVEAISAKYGNGKAKKKTKGKNKERRKGHPKNNNNSRQRNKPLGSSSMDDWESIDKELDRILEIFPGSSRESIKSLYHANGRDGDAVVEKLFKDPSLTHRKQPASAYKTDRVIVAFTQKPQTQPKAPLEYTKVERSCRQNYMQSSSGYDSDPEHCRDMAEQLKQQRNQMYTKATSAFKRRNNRRGNSGIAGYYAQEGHVLHDKAKEWNMRAAQAYVDSARQSNRDPYLLDLHHLTRAEAIEIAQQELNIWYTRETRNIDNTTIKPFKIITGFGRHSSSNTPVLYPAIQKLLLSESWKFRLINGGFVVLGAK